MLLVLSWQAGIPGERLAEELAAELNCSLLNAARLEAALNQHRASLPSALAAPSSRHNGAEAPAPAPRLESQRRRLEMRESMLAAAMAAPLIIANLGGEYVFSAEDALRVRLVASRRRRLAWLAETRGLDPAAAAPALAAEAAATPGLQRGGEPRPDRYDLLLNCASFGLAGCRRRLREAAALLPPGPLPAARGERLRLHFRLRFAETAAPAAVPAPAIPLGAPAAPAPLHFAHPSERIFAQVLDFYRIQWQYEPRCFPLEQDAEGRVTEAFTPDFYLPDQNLYIELTTMKQSLVTRKNRKIRRLGELYPDVKIRMVYQKDFEDLIFRLGLESEAGGGTASF